MCVCVCVCVYVNIYTGIHITATRTKQICNWTCWTWWGKRSTRRINMGTRRLILAVVLFLSAHIAL